MSCLKIHADAKSQGWSRWTASGLSPLQAQQVVRLHEQLQGITAIIGWQGFCRDAVEFFEEHENDKVVLKGCFEGFVRQIWVQG